MAINKAKTSPWMKGFIIFLILAFVVGVSAGGIVGIVQAFTPQASTTNPAATTTTALTVEQINANYQPGVDALAAAAQSQPTSYTAHVNLGNAYYDWANELSTPGKGQSQATTAALVAADPLWGQARDAYAKAVKIQPGDPGVSTDFAIVTFYSRDTSSAILIAEKVTKTTPSFAQAWLNLGVFYANSGQNAKAITAFEKYIKLDPKGNNVSFATDQVKQLKSATVAP